MNKTVKTKLSRLFCDLSHPAQAHLIEILAGKTSISSSGYPYISERSFQIFLTHVPHLFMDGERLLRWLGRAEKKLEDSEGLAIAALNSIRNGFKVLKTVVQTAAVCAPSDLWLLRQIFATHQELLSLAVFDEDKWRAEADIAQFFGFQPLQLHWDFSLLEARGYLDSKVSKARVKLFRRGKFLQVQKAWRAMGSLPKEWRCDMAEKLAVSWGKGAEEFLEMPARRASNHPKKRQGWVPTAWEVEVGYRLVPALLALHQLGVLKSVKAGAVWEEVAPKAEAFAELLKCAGVIDGQGRVTQLGERVCERAVGPLGIIHAYHPYTDRLVDLLKTSDRRKVWVDRGKNVAASQNANRKTFELANASLDRFCEDTGFSFNVFVEHALGQGEATRQRYEADRGRAVSYFGADLEEAAIDRAVAAQQKGTLPQAMQFIRRADIGRPELVVDFIRRAGASTEGAVMIVGNGFHEVRGQDDRRIVEIFKGYCDAGMLLIFTEESELSDFDLRCTAWNTYHTGFRYTHQISGQGLRAATALGMGGRLGWSSCVEGAGYVLLKKYSERTRTVYPYALKDRVNPPISMTYFCVPKKLWRALG